MLTKFLDLQLLCSSSTTSDNAFFFQSLSHEAMKPDTATNFTSLQQTMIATTHLIRQSQFYSCPVNQIDGREQPCHKLIPPRRENFCSDLSMEFLGKMYALLYPEPSYEILHVERFYYESKQIMVNGEEFITTQARSQRSSAIVAHWRGVTTDIDVNGVEPVRIGVINFCFSSLCNG